jgi:hypothetical protein
LAVITIGHIFSINCTFEPLWLLTSIRTYLLFLGVQLDSGPDQGLEGRFIDPIVLMQIDRKP